MKKYIPVIPIADPFAWTPNPTWWDYKDIFKNDTPPEGFQKRAIFLYYDSGNTLSLHDVVSYQQGAYFRLSDEWEGLYNNNGSMYHTWNTDYDKPCDLGYNTRYCIVYTPIGQRDLNLGNLSSSDYNSILLAYIDDVNITNLYCSYTSIEAFITTKKTTASNVDNWSGYSLSGRNLKYVVLPKGLKRLPSYFFERSAIREIELPEGLEEIGNSCFYECFKLEKITFPNSLTKIGEYAFQYCMSLKEFKAPTSLKFIDRYAFYYCPSLEKIELNEGLEYLGYDAFSCCSFREARLPSTLKHISYFYNCWNLKKLILPEGLERIEIGVMNGTTPIGELKLPKSLTSMEGGIGNDYWLKKLIVDEGFVPPGTYFYIPSRLYISSLCEDFLRKLGDNKNNATIHLSYGNTGAVNTYDPTIIPELQTKNYSI